MTGVVEMVPPEAVAVPGPAVWPEAFAELFALVAGEFAQAPSRRRARGYLLGLLSHSERKNGWTIAEFAGDAGPEGMQRLLNFYAWDQDAVRDALRQYVVKAFGDPAGVLAADETGFLKKGRMSAGVQRQYSGTAGRVENCQLGVFLAYAAPGGSRALIDRELYLPESWTGDRDRCRQAGIGGDVEFATKPELARKMLERAVAAGVPFSWFTADEAYGQNPGLRDWLEEQQISYVMAGPGHHLLARRALTPNAKGELELAFFLCSAPPGTTLTELAAVAGARWAIEDCFAEAKNEAGLDHYQVRKYHAWYRHVTLSMLAHAFLAVTAAAANRPGPPPAPGGTGKKGTPGLWTAIQPAENI